MTCLYLILECILSLSSLSLWFSSLTKEYDLKAQDNRQGKRKSNHDGIVPL